MPLIRNAICPTVDLHEVLPEIYNLKGRWGRADTLNSKSHSSRSRGFFENIKCQIRHLMLDKVSYMAYYKAEKGAKTMERPLQRLTVVALKKLGRDLKDARRRRRISMRLLAERAAISLSTLNRIERGDPAVSMAHYASVIFTLGLLENLRNLADITQDPVGRHLEDEHLPKRIHPAKNYV